MSKLRRIITASIATGLCALGTCGLQRKYKFSLWLADLVRSFDPSPFLWTRLYAFMPSRLMRPLYTALADEIVDAGRYSHILDLSTGLGCLPIEIALRDPHTHVYGIVELQNMVRTAKANARANKVGKSVHFARGDADKLPYPGGYFDLVVSAKMLHYKPVPKEVFAEVNHVIKPGGEFWFCDYQTDISPETWESIQATLPIRDRVLFAVGPISSAMSAYSEAELLNMASEADFEVVVFEHKTFTIFGQPMPLFNLLKLKKPLAVGEHDTPGPIESTFDGSGQ
jgi:ubiquinone/menaquinone biosynthesis C-methylase UbiE